MYLQIEDRDRMWNKYTTIKNRIGEDLRGIYQNEIDITPEILNFHKIKHKEIIKELEDLEHELLDLLSSKGVVK